MKFKKGQTVYYFEETSPYIGRIVATKILGATKDLETGKITYKVDVSGFICHYADTIEEKCLYKTCKAALKDHKDEVAYFALMNRINSLEDSVNKVFSEYAEKMVANPVNWASISIENNTPSIQIEGIGDLKEEFNKLKDEVAGLKKKIKKPTKKPVVKEKKEKEAVGI